MKQATLKAAGTAALGIAIAAVGAGGASAAPAAATGGLGLPTSLLTNPAATSAVTEAAGKLPVADKVSGTLGTLAPSAGQAAAPAANRAGVPSIPGLDKTPLGGLTQTLPLPGLGG
ncbi:ATP-binding protein [Kitasatospora purpeofusca]|uniref:ATP-binding protein n=1 Tax=Kitasatospora purpeofusca TaxID=67352 RepID=UPI002A59AC12|nr:ATP-binding protein [Kitasatospora purpeofusca]MDY0810140.1 ATP-binding protein [Kitasatospora purpeofusca]